MATLDEVLNAEVRAENVATMGGKDGDVAEEDGDDKLKKRVNEGAWGIAKEKVDVQVSVERVQNFEEAFLRIKAATGITDIEELVRTFIKNEDQNFSLFNYVNEQTNELEKVEEQIEQLREEEARFAQASGEDGQAQKEVLRELEGKVEATEASVVRFDARSTATQKTTDELKRGIGSMFAKLECEAGPVLSGSATVTEANIMLFLGVIEQRCNLILQQYAATQSKERGRQSRDDDDGTQAVLSVLGAGPTTPMGQDLIHVNPPKLDEYSSEDGSDDDEGDFRPLTRDELKAKALNRMNRRSKGGGGGKHGKK
jgi:hypothetical protein